MTDPDRLPLPSVQQRDFLQAATRIVLDTPPGVLRDLALGHAVSAARAVILDGSRQDDVARAMGIGKDVLADWFDQVSASKPQIKAPAPRRERFDSLPAPPTRNRFDTSISHYATVEQHVYAYAASSQTQGDRPRPMTIWTLLYLSGDSRKCRNAFDVEAGDLRELIDPAPQFRWEERVSVRSGTVADEMRNHRPHLLHLSGHQEKNGLLLTEMARNDWRLVDITLLAEQLARHGPPRLAVLNVCDSIDFAELLIKREVTAVIAWEGELDDTDASRFNRLFYHHLVRGRTVAEALASAHDVGEWPGCAPRLFGAEHLRFLQ